MKEKKKFSVIDRLNSFKYAINGLKLFVLQEHNARIHVLAAIVVVLCGIFFKFDSIKWIAVFMVIAIVFIAELLNPNRSLENRAFILREIRHDYGNN